MSDLIFYLSLAAWEKSDRITSPESLILKLER